MFSKAPRGKSLLLWSGLVAFVFIEAACSKLNQAPPAAPNYTLSSTACLTSAIGVAKDFAAGDGQPAAITGAWDCLGGTIQSFERYVRGTSNDSYTAQELATFLEVNFLPKDSSGQPVNKISPELQSQFMKVKQIFVGGSRDVLTRQELLDIVAVFGSLRDMTLRINPYVKVLTLKWQMKDVGGTDQELDFFEQANTTVQGVAKDFSDLLRPDHQPYQLDDAVNLLRELAKFSNENWSAVESLQRFMPIIKEVKHALTDQPGDAVYPSEWRTMFLLGGRSYIQYLRYAYFIKDPSLHPNGLRVNYVARTFEDTFSIFEDLVSNKPSGSVNRDEIDQILAAIHDAWPDFNTSTVLVDQFMKIKIVLFGGTTSGFNVADFTKARLKVPALKNMIERFLPYYKVYSGLWIPTSLSRTDALTLYQQAHDALDSSAHDFGALLESPYDLNDLNILLAEMERLYPSQTPDDRIDQPISKYMGTLIQIKNTIYEDQGSVIRKDQWPSLLGFGNRIFTGYLFYKYFVLDQSDLNPQTLDSWSRMLNITLQYVTDILNVKSKKQISTDEIQAILLQLQKAGLLPPGIKASELKSLTQAVLSRVLVQPQQRLAGLRPQALALASLQDIRWEFDIWLQGQLFLLDTFKESNQMKLSAYDMQLAISNEGQLNSIPNALKTVLPELWVPAFTTVPFAFDSKQRLKIAVASPSKFDFAAMETHNWVRTAVRIFINSYAMDMARINSHAGLTQDEVQQAYLDFKPIAVSFGIVDPSDTNFMKSRFRDASIFMPHSDGGPLASFGEIHDLINALVSGLRLSNILQADLIQACHLPTHPKHLKRHALPPVVSEDCLYKTAKATIGSSFTSLPDLQKFEANTSDQDFHSFFNDVMTATNTIPVNGNVKFADVSLLPQILQYIELFYARFDANGDGVITPDEARIAYPAFETILKQVAAKELHDGTLKESDLLAVFMWTLKNGKPPAGLWQDIEFLFFKGDPSSWKFAASRSQVAKILAYISVATRPPATPAPAPTPAPTPHRMADRDANEDSL